MDVDISKKATVAEQAVTISSKINKNSVEITTPGVKYHYDLKAAPHKGVKTPHVQRSFRNINPEGKAFWNKDTKWVRSMNQQDIRIVKKVIE